MRMQSRLREPLDHLAFAYDIQGQRPRLEAIEVQTLIVEGG